MSEAISCRHCGKYSPRNKAHKQKVYCSTSCARRAVIGSPEERFWKFVDKNPSGCWVWKGAKSKRGYGELVIEYRTVVSHRFSYTLHYGCDIPRGVVVCHACDNPSCVRPDHLFLGTDADNVADKVAKGRQAKGVQIKNSKLTDEAVRAIRQSEASTRALAEEFGVSGVTIRLVRRNKIWKHVL